MAIENPTWANADRTSINAIIDGCPGGLPAKPGNRHYDELIASKAVIAPFVPAPKEPDKTPEEKLAAIGLTVDDLKMLVNGEAIAAAAVKS